MFLERWVFVLSVGLSSFYHGVHGLLLCGNVSVEALEICDHLWHCKRGEDETNCKAVGVLESVVIQSPGYSDHRLSVYPNDIHMVWTIKAQSHLALDVIFDQHYGIEENYDSLAIGRGSNPSHATTLAFYSGLKRPSPYLVEYNEIWIRFQSDMDKGGIGFKMSVVAVDTKDLLRCENGKIVHPTEICDVQWHCPDGRDERTCDPILADQPFILHSPSFPFHYPQNLDITWTATTILSRRFLLEFAIFHTEEVFDFLQVGSGMDCKHTFNYSFSGDGISDPVITSDHTLCVHFTSDYSVSTTGFLINITTIESFDEGCSTRPAEGVRARIIGGSDAYLGDWPWIGSLRDSDGGHLCAASLIHPEWAVTAAHCIGHGGEKLVFGDLLLSEESSFHHEFTYNTTLHPLYSPVTFQHDIALLHLNGTVHISHYVRPICSSTNQNETFEYQECLIAGWGIKSLRTGSLSNRLQEANVPIIDQLTCFNYLSSIQFAPDIMLCAGFDAGGVDSCDGDSGGPLMCRNAKDRWDLVGVTSIGVHCAFPRLPGVYTRVSAHLDFLKEHIPGY
ncbi:Enteropeptidase [Holothuria leucospilota]|uniref:Enteropeptidase n=1 Tax=Holothuria leucospilota TaxID=206669 RepID=A0A9Q0YHB8_HOLLE|nr:Enteropeptidase [Holothuria leucospilota]